MSRRLGALALIAFAFWLVGCGGGASDRQLSEGAVRQCLAASGIRERPAGSGQTGAKGYAPIYAADFTAYTSGGTSVGVVMQGSAERASATAADVRSSLRSFGLAGADAASRVVFARNVVAIFDRSPSSADRDAVRACLAG